MATVIAGRYRLDDVRIGKGGMGEVWGATDTRLRRRVAVKLISFPDEQPDQELISRFVRESQLTARIEHPGVPVIYDAARVTDGPFQGRLFLVMQLIDGINVDDLVAEHDPLPVGWAAAIAAQTCAVLSYAHAKHLVHRDLKPSNLMLSADGRVKVLDFGLAVALDASERSRFTRTNQTVGTLAYMSPEQFRGESSARSDLYALGCVLHRMLTGKSPFEGPTEASIMHGQLYEKPTPVRRLRPDVPAGLETLVLRLLSKDPGGRPASADEVYEELMPHVGDLEELPGILNPGLEALRMYADVVGRIWRIASFASPSGSAGDGMAAARRVRSAADGRCPTRSPAERPDPFSLGDLARARRQAQRLTRESRYDEAARILSGVADRAVPVIGSGHREVLEVRIDLANILFNGGEYAQAAEAFQQLSRDLSERDGPDNDLVLNLRLQEATCHAILGNGDRAIGQLERLLADNRRVYGEDDDRVTALRQQIGLLMHGVGRTAEGVRRLEGLAADLERRHGPSHPDVREVREMIRRLKDG